MTVEITVRSQLAKVGKEGICEQVRAADVLRAEFFRTGDAMEPGSAASRQTSGCSTRASHSQPPPTDRLLARLTAPPG